MYCCLLNMIAGTFVLLWRRGSSVLTAGHLKITRDSRFKIVGDYNLQIKDVKTQDAGDYICQIGDQETRDQVHTVEILGRFQHVTCRCQFWTDFSEMAFAGFHRDEFRTEK